MGFLYVSVASILRELARLIRLYPCLLLLLIAVINSRLYSLILSAILIDSTILTRQSFAGRFSYRV